MAVLEGGGSARDLEPILTCVQCETEYRQSENAGTPLKVLLLLFYFKQNLSTIQILMLCL